MEKALANLKQSGVRNVYLDGSFATQKTLPADIDGCWDAHPEIDIDILDPVFLDFAEGREAMKRKYGVDFFIAQTIEGASGQPFIDFFQTNRDGQKKGILLLKL